MDGMEIVRTGITGGFGVPREKENGRRVVEFCAERGLCVVNTYFKYKNWHKYSRIARGQGSGSKEPDRSGAGEEGYAVLCRM